VLAVKYFSPPTRIRYFGHHNIIKFSQRPFLTKEQRSLAQEMNRQGVPWRDKKMWDNIETDRPGWQEREVEPVAQGTPDLFDESVYRTIELVFKDPNWHQTLIDNWNSVVKKGDRVYHLGDFAYKTTRERVHEVLDQLNGSIYFVYGNHDKLVEKNPDIQERFIWHRWLTEIKIKDPDIAPYKRKITLCHFSLRTWFSSHHGSCKLYGHSHDALTVDPDLQAFDVGVDCHDFTPISYERVKQVMAETKNPFIPIGEREAV